MTSVRALQKTSEWTKRLFTRIDPREAADLSKFFFYEQLKFTLLQTLILLELTITSSSKLVYVACGFGGVLLLFLTLMQAMRNSFSRLSLVYIYPLQVSIATVWLSSITLFKVFYANEQTDLSLLFLGFAMLGENIFLTAEAIPRVTHFFLSRDDIQHNNLSSKQNNFYDDIYDDDLMVSERVCATCLRCLDLIGLVFLLITIGVAIVIGGIHLVFTYPIKVCVLSRNRDRFMRFALKRERSLRERRRSLMPKTVSEKSKQALEKELGKQFLLYLTIFFVTVEFLIIATASAAISGGIKQGGTPFNREVD